MPEQKPYGYTGKILRVNLADSSTSVEEPDAKFYRRYFGGTGVSGYYLLKELAPGVDPLGPDNVLVFSAGVITGIPVAGSGRTGIGSKSPLTGAFGDSQAGGFWPAELKLAGWDAIVIKGKAANPVYLWINDDKVEIRDASHLWGKATKEVESQIKDELGDTRVRVAQIGSAGEKMVRFASVFNDLNHTYGRDGHGAVMGSKNLRAIAVRGHQPVALANAEKVRQVARSCVELLKAYPQPRTAHGTAGGAVMLNAIGMLPTRNFQEGQFEHAADIDGTKMTETILVGRGNCHACPIDCKREVEVGPPYDVDRAYGGPEYETVAALGSLCGVGDLKAIAKGNAICHVYGMDTISTGVTIAFAMECFENGILTEKDTGGIELRFGNAQAMMTMAEMIGKREGLGDILAEGTRRAAEKIGKGAAEYAIQVKGQEVPLHDPRGKIGTGLGYAVSPTGAEHVSNILDIMFAAEGPAIEAMKPLGIQEPVSPLELSPAKVRLYQYLTNWSHFKNCAVVCVFPPLNFNHMVELVEGATGWNTSLWELMKVGERALALGRVFNAREGLTAKDDTLPARFHTAYTSGPLKGIGISREALQQGLETHYRMAGWDPEGGAPTVEKLHELDLGWTVDELARAVARK